ncbi:PAS domain S-box-containing protein [Sphingomonas kaistensis]|uniref:histidine kinase n=1 Tax=Sphingomonas kaistensis TaxID=298708 RepID=A0A7X5Y411_9SPHN|nr:ATP-binding protein [Sphingomonas kaistensis]NJC04782.1 PAS domain S-box-containing protein [Sphingomonas kaistensis]
MGSAHVGNRVWLPAFAFFLMFALALAGIELTREGGRIASVWVANAAIIAILLRTARPRWPLLLLASFAGNVAAGLVSGDRSVLVVALAACNLAEIAIVCLLFARRFAVPATLDSPARLIHLALLAVVGPAVSTLLAGLSLALAQDGAAIAPLAHWWLADCLGILILTPLLVTLAHARGQRERGQELEYGLLLLLAAAVTGAVFARTTPFIFLITPVLMFAGLRLSLQRCATLVLAVSAIALALTFGGLGPLNHPLISDHSRIFLIQAFLATAVALTLPVSALRHDRARTASSLLLREEHYRLLADNSSDLVLRLTADGDADYVSSASERMLGLTAGDLHGRALAGRINPEDRSRFAAAVERARRHGDSMTCFRMRHACGQDRWIEAHMRLAGPAERDTGGEVAAPCTAAAEGRCAPGAATPCAAGGRATFGAVDRPVVANLRDIHDRRTAELLAADSAARLRESNRLLTMAEGLASLGHWVFDPARKQLALSAEAAAMLGLARRTVVARDALGRLHPQDRLRLLRTLAAAYRVSAPVECTIRLHEDVGRTLQLRMHLHGDDRASSLFGVVSDITAKLEDEHRLVSALEEARAAASFRSQFLATMSHEIRTPMTGVIGMIELLESDPTSDERELYLNTLRQSGDLLMAVVNDILDFSKVDAGRITIADEPFDVGATLLTTLRLFDRPASSRGLALRLDGPDPGALWLRGDALRVRQVLSNLLSNAIKFSERGDVLLRCAVQRIAGDRHRVRLSVTDQGIGIPPSLRARLFEPFVQGADGTPDGGTGLGLAISRRLVAAMGGTIQVQSRPRQGSTFTITLTLADAVPAAAGDDEGALAALGAGPEGALDILLAEDNPVNQLLVTALCRRLGHRVTCAANGQQAAALAAAKAFDLILMDIQMPRCDGLTATRLIRAGGGASAAVPIIALTADAACSSQRADYDAAGFDGLLTKPIDSAAFTRTLGELAGAARLPAASPVAPEKSDGSALDRPVIEELRAMLGGARLDQLLRLLSDELDQRPRAIRAALADRAFDAAAAEAHSLKGAAANLGACRVAAAARELERCIAAAAAGEGRLLAPALRHLSVEVGRAQQALAELRREPQPELLRA